jgi:serine/threonine protein kinase
MGAVYLALDTQQGQRQVAIKELSQSHLGEMELKEVTARFEQEARMLHALSHPNLPCVYEAFSENGRAYLVMDFIDGKTLQQVLKDAKGPLPVQQVLSYANQICNVLSYLHQHNPPIIFRDVKPTNIMITPQGHVFLIDFGIARFFKEGQTQDTVYLGSPGYAPPEQHGLSQTSPRSDIYGLGATLHYCLTGRDPYYIQERFSFPSIHAQNQQVPMELDQLILRMVAYKPENRPASTQEVQQAIAYITQGAAQHTTAMAAGQHPAFAPTQYVAPIARTPQGNRGPNTPETPYTPITPVTPTIAAQPPRAPTQLQQPIQPVRSAAQTPSLSLPWTRSFLTLSGIILLVTIGASFLVMFGLYPIKYGYAFLLEAGLSLVLLLTAVIMSGRVQGTVPRTLLLLTSIGALLAGLAGLSIGWVDIGSLLAPVISVDTLGQMLTYGLAGAVLVSLVWLTRPFTWVNRAILFALSVVATVCIYVHIPIATTDTLKHVLLVVALIILIQSTLLAVQMERVQQH